MTASETDRAPSETRQQYGNRAATQASQAMLEALLQASIEPIVLIDSSGTILRTNDAVERLFGHRPSELEGRNVNVLMPERWSSQHDGYIERYLRTGERHIIGRGREVEGLHRDGTAFPIHLSVGVAEVGGLKYFVGLIRDLTQRHRLERETAEARNRLAHMNRISTLGEMASGIAHEVNQPLGAISNYAQAARIMIQSSGSDPDRLSDILERIAFQAQRAGDVIRRMRSLAKSRDSTRETTDINDLVRDIAQLAEVDARFEGVPLILDLQQDLPPVCVDAIQIQQVVLNLLRNGLDAMQGFNDGGVLLLKTTRDGIEDVAISVIDGGHGVDSRVAADIMSPFVSTKDTGMGMGLAICQSIVTSHGGRLGFEDNPSGPGTRFYIILPTDGPGRNSSGPESGQETRTHDTTE